MRRLSVALFVLVVFTAGVIATFPTERLARVLRARLPPAVARVVARVGTTRLGCRGLTIDDLTLRARPAAPTLDVRSLSLRPSLLGLLAGRGGRPWEVQGSACGGGATAHLDRAPDGDALTVRFQALDLAACLAPLEPNGPVEGSADGEAAFTLGSGTVMGRGTLAVTQARWQPAGVPHHFPLRAERATLRWTLADRTLRIDDFAMTNDEFAASGTGAIHFPSPPGTAELDMRIHLQPARTMLQAHRDLLNKLPGSPPDATGGRTFHIGGPLDAPQIGMPG
jgi:type II secretion system protein N